MVFSLQKAAWDSQPVSHLDMTREHLLLLLEDLDCPLSSTQKWSNPLVLKLWEMRAAYIYTVLTSLIITDLIKIDSNEQWGKIGKNHSGDMVHEEVTIFFIYLYTEKLNKCLRRWKSGMQYQNVIVLKYMKMSCSFYQKKKK